MTAACVVFEDQYVDQLRPINLPRMTCKTTCGACNLDQLLAASLKQPLHHFVRPHLEASIERAGERLAREVAGPVLYVNAALTPNLISVRRLAELSDAGQPFLMLNDQRIGAALCTRDFPSELAFRDGGELTAYLLDQRLPVLDEELDVFGYAFDVVRHHDALLEQHLSWIAERGSYQMIAERVYAGSNADIASHVVFDTSDGPIVIGDNVRIRPFGYIAGPVRIGDNCLVLDHAALKHGTSLGHTVKAGGEVESSIIEPYSNKQHHGFLGHAYVGSWVNLGAGTSNSDLKNTYGEISIDYDGESVSTGMQFLGCVIGDYTKTAINTSILTGKMIGVSSLIYGYVATNVPSFTNYARSFGQVTEVGVEIAIRTQVRAAKRRKVEVDDVDRQLFQDLYELTRAERRLSTQQISL